MSLYVFTGAVQKIGRFCYEALNPYSERDKSSRKSSAPQIGKLAFFSRFTGLIKINNIMFLSVLYTSKTIRISDFPRINTQKEQLDR